MGKRLIRIRATQLRNTPPAELIDRLVGADVDLVFTNGRTLHGRLTDLQAGEVFLRDHIGHQHKVPVQNLDELILDEVAPY